MWCIPSAPLVQSTRTKPVEYQHTTHTIRYRALFCKYPRAPTIYPIFSFFCPKNYTQNLQKFFFKILFLKNYYIILSRNHYKRVDNLPSVSLIIFNITVSYWWSMKFNSPFQYDSIRSF